MCREEEVLKLSSRNFLMGRHSIDHDVRSLLVSRPCFADEQNVKPQMNPI